jgi:hypothetical protein
VHESDKRKTQDFCSLRFSVTTLTLTVQAGIFCKISTQPTVMTMQKSRKGYSIIISIVIIEYPSNVQLNTNSDTA